MKEKHSKKQDFTLLELLIVVAIIAILAGILLPALTQALNKSRAISCLSGMKQLGIAAQNYLDTYNDTIFVMHTDYKNFYYDEAVAAYADVSMIARDAAGLSGKVCAKDPGKYTPWVPQKNVCSIIALAEQKGRANDNNTIKHVSLCSASTASCSGHLQYYWFYGMVMGTSCLSASSLYYHKTSRLRQASVSLFWSEGGAQVQKSSPLGDLSKDNTKFGFWRHADRTNVLYFDGHAGSVGMRQTSCAHTVGNATVKDCASCRFWFPYKK